MIKLGSLFDGVGGWQLAAVRNGIVPVWSSEIDDFCRDVTRRHFPQTIQLGDINTIDLDSLEHVDIITAGFPCNDLSIAGKREGIFGDRSCLFFRAVDIIKHVKPRFAVFENVVGLLTSNGGLDFKSVLEQIAETKLPLPKSWTNAGLVESGVCQVAWRIFDAQYFGVPQRRRRIFIVADFTGQRAAEILFESKGLQRHFETCRVKTKAIAPTPEESTVKCFGIGRDFFNQGYKGQFGLSLSEELQPPLTARGAAGVFDGCHVRRLTPLECERLMGLPDDWTIGECDTKRYKAIGNGMAQPIADWILQQINFYFED